MDRENVGYIGVSIDEKYNIEKNVKNWFILSIGVLKPYRRKGIGTSLMLQGLKSLQTRGMTKAMLDVDDLNPTKTVKLYEKIGFQVVKKYQFWEKPYALMRQMLKHQCRKRREFAGDITTCQVFLRNYGRPPKERSLKSM